MRILMMTPDKNDGTSFYRAAGIANDLQRQTGWMIDIENFGDNEISWTSLVNYDLIMMQRPCNLSHVKIVQLARLMGKKIWVDYDDDYLNLPYHHKVVQFYRNNRHHLEALLGLSDMVTVSTASIKNSMGENSDHVHIVPNAIQDHLLRPATETFSDFLIWRGGDTHIVDLGMHAAELQQVIN